MEPDPFADLLCRSVRRVFSCVITLNTCPRYKSNAVGCPLSPEIKVSGVSPGPGIVVRVDAMAGDIVLTFVAFEQVVSAP